jgi:hypothetical protein
MRIPQFSRCLVRYASHFDLTKMLNIGLADCGKQLSICVHGLKCLVGVT